MELASIRVCPLLDRIIVPEAGKEKFEKVFEKFNQHFISKRNTIHEQAKFHQRGESIETHKKPMRKFEFWDFTDKKGQIRDRLVIGISGKEHSERLQIRSDLTLEKAVNISRQSEMVKSQIKDQCVICK